MSTGDSLLNLLIYTYFNFVNSVQFDIKKQTNQRANSIHTVGSNMHDNRTIPFFIERDKFQ